MAPSFVAILPVLNEIHLNSHSSILILIYNSEVFNVSLEKQSRIERIQFKKSSLALEITMKTEQIFCQFNCSTTE